MAAHPPRSAGGSWAPSLRSSPASRRARLLVKGWQAATGNNPPGEPGRARHPVDRGDPYALASGAAMGLARMLATRKAAGYYRKSTGHLPPGMEEVT